MEIKNLQIDEASKEKKEIIQLVLEIKDNDVRFLSILHKMIKEHVNNQ